MVVLLVILSILAAGAGLMMLSPATMGVGALTFACLFGILARIAQAGDQSKALVTSVLAAIESQQSTKAIH